MTEYKACEIGSDVWAISFWNKDGKKTDHCAIYPAKVKGVTFEYEKEDNEIKTFYHLTTPIGTDWGDYVDSLYVAKTFEELIGTMKSVWRSNANTFGE